MANKPQRSKVFADLTSKPATPSKPPTPSKPAKPSKSSGNGGSGNSGVHLKSQRRTLAALLIAWGGLVAYAASNSKQKPGEKRAAIAAVIVVMLILSLLGELSPELATGFAGLLLLSMLIAGPTNAFGYITKTLPSTFIKSAGG